MNYRNLYVLESFLALEIDLYCSPHFNREGGCTQAKTWNNMADKAEHIIFYCNHAYQLLIKTARISKGIPIYQTEHTGFLHNNLKQSYLRM